jgi:xylulokinase
MKRLILAHDLGTTGDKATLFDDEGRMVGSSFETYPTEYAHFGWAEQDPERWWTAVCNATKGLLAKTHASAGDVACVVFSGQMMGCVALDDRARPLRNAIIWADQRSQDQERAIGERIDAAEVYRITGHRLSASYSLCKMLWLRDHEPEVFRRTHKFVNAKDAIVARLTGAFVTDLSDASGTNLYDLVGGTWSPPILEASELEVGVMPTLHPATDVVGGVSATVADEVGLEPDTPVVIGGGDGACAAAGAGVIEPGNAYNYIGSSSWIGLSTSSPILDPAQRTFTWAHLLPGRFSPTGTMQAAGASYQWMRDHVSATEVEAGGALGVSAYELMNLVAATSPVGANGLLFLPYLLGERSPRWNPRARGAFIGLDIRHGRADMLRAVLEGVTLNLRVILEAFRNQGAALGSMRLIGGGASGRFWNQIMADVFGMPVHRLAHLEEATSMGAALAGGVGVGLYRGFDLIERMNPVVETLHPIPEHAPAYERAFSAFEAAYEALVPVFDLMAGSWSPPRRAVRDRSSWSS